MAYDHVTNAIHALRDRLHAIRAGAAEHAVNLQYAFRSAHNQYPRAINRNAAIVDTAASHLFHGCACKRMFIQTEAVSRKPLMTARAVW